MLGKFIARDFHSNSRWNAIQWRKSIQNFWSPTSIMLVVTQTTRLKFWSPKTKFGHPGPILVDKIEHSNKKAFKVLRNSHLKCCEYKLNLWRGVLDTTLCDEICQWLATGQWFSPGTLVSSTNKPDHHDITEIFLKVALNTINLNLSPFKM